MNPSPPKKKQQPDKHGSVIHLLTSLSKVDIPSGYVLEQPDADAIVRSNVVPEMKDAIANEYAGKTIWFFDRVPNETRCFEHTVRRYFPVANLTRTRQAVLIEPLRPERFTVRQQTKLGPTFFVHHFPHTLMMDGEGKEKVLR